MTRLLRILLILLLGCFFPTFALTAPAFGNPIGEPGFIGYDAPVVYDGSQNSSSAYEDAARPPTAEENHTSGAARTLLSRIADLPAAETGDALQAPHTGMMKVLQSGVDVPVPQGATGIRTMMADITATIGNEVGLLRPNDGSRVLRIDGPNELSLENVETVIVHTQPNGILEFSGADIRALTERDQLSSILIDPQSAVGVRVGVSGNWQYGQLETNC